MTVLQEEMIASLAGQGVAPWLNVFIDESGDHDIDTDKQGPSRLFIVAAVIVDDQQLAAAVEQIDRISARLNNGSEIRSKKIGSKHQRRLAFLNAIQDVPFKFVSMIINKEAVEVDSGLRFRRSFHKYFHRILQARLATYGGGLRVSMDEYGGHEFMEGFSKYLDEHVAATLFYGYEQQFVHSQDSRLIQLADLMAGSLAYCFDDDKRCEATPQLRELLRKKQLDVWAWPPVERAEMPPGSVGSDDELDERISVAARNRAFQFHQVHRDDDNELVRAQVETLDMLLFASLHGEGAEQSIYGADIVQRLHVRGLGAISDQTFRTSVIGPLRDSGIVIAGTWHGYRLALSTLDIADYLSHSQNIVIPMLARISRARSAVLQDLATNYDILDPAEYAILRAIVERFGDAEIEALTASTATDEPDEELQ